MVIKLLLSFLDVLVAVAVVVGKAPYCLAGQQVGRVVISFSSFTLKNLSFWFQAVKQEEEINQQSQELAEARKNYTSESEKVREKL